MKIEITDKDVDISSEEYQVLRDNSIIKIEELTSFQGNVYERLTLDLNLLIKKFLIYENGLNSYDGPINEYKVLILLNDFKTINPKLIKSKLNISNAYVHRILKDLMKKDLINQIESGLYQITDKGKNKLFGKG
ncbi:MAG: MarR family transcriptional regulator [Candidatus Helarchaeota archaeon]